MVALKSQHHKQCLVALYTCYREHPDVNQPEDSTPHEKASLRSYIGEETAKCLPLTARCQSCQILRRNTLQDWRGESDKVAVKALNAIKGEITSKPPRTKCAWEGREAGV